MEDKDGFPLNSFLKLERPAAALASCRTGLRSASWRVLILIKLRFEKIAGLANAFPDKAPL
jgi:hypothetical protein